MSIQRKYIHKIQESLALSIIHWCRQVGGRSEVCFSQAVCLAPGQQRGLERSPDPKVLTMLNTSQGLGAQKNSAVGLEDDAETKVNIPSS